MKRKPRTDYTPHEHQRRILRSKARITAAVAGHGGGKTTIGPRWLFDRIRERPGEDWIVAGPTYKTLDDATLPALKAHLESLGLRWNYGRVQGYGYRASERLYVLPASVGGGRIIVISAERPGSMQGIHAAGFWLDEVIGTGYAVYETLLGRIALREGRGLISSTPYDRGWLYEHVYQAWINVGQPTPDAARDVYVEQWRSIDNPAYPQAEWDRLRRTLPAWRFRLLYEAEFDSPAGLVYDCMAWIARHPIPSNAVRSMTIDWGTTDPMAALWLAEERSPEGGTVRTIYDEYYQSGFKAAADGTTILPAEMLAEIIDRCRGRGEKLAAVYADPSRNDLIELARQMFDDAGVCSNVQPADNGWDRGYEAVYGALKVGTLRAFDDLAYLKDEAGRYMWRLDGRGEPRRGGKPKDADDHLMDCLRYAMVGAKDTADAGRYYATKPAFGVLPVMADGTPDPFHGRISIYRDREPVPVTAPPVDRNEKLTPEQVTAIYAEQDRVREELRWIPPNGRTGMAMRRHEAGLVLRLARYPRPDAAPLLTREDVAAWRAEVSKLEGQLASAPIMVANRIRLRLEELHRLIQAA